MTSDPDFKVTTFFEVEYLKDKVTIAQEEAIPIIWIMECYCLMTLIDL